LYEEIYCARGDMENRIKECQLDLFVDRTSAATMRANQLRLWFAAALLSSTPNSPTRPAVRSASSSSRSARSCAPACGASKSRWLAYPYQHEFALAHALLTNAAER
jgi:hypothetical protein